MGREQIILVIFSSQEEVDNLKQEYADGISWGDAKIKLFNLMNSKLMPIRERSEELKKDKDFINDLLLAGAKKVQPIAAEILGTVRDLVGISDIKQFVLEFEYFNSTKVFFCFEIDFFN